MHFFRRPGVIHLDCFTDRADVFALSKIDHSMKFIPDWWKSLPKSVNNTDNHLFPTLKTCQGFIDLFKNGIILPLWSDLSINLAKINHSDNLNTWQFADQMSIIEIHNFQQRGNFLPKEEYQHFKILSPWHLKTKEDLNWVVTGNTWVNNDLSKIFFTEGMLNFKWQAQSNINMFCKRENKDQNILLEAGQPMLQFIPMSDKKIVLHHHLVSEYEFVNIAKSKRRFTFINGYNKGKKILQEQESKCPFGFK
jgi:hypothetical protein